jgi:5'(3')-deoxyribonucleotidase
MTILVDMDDVLEQLVEGMLRYVNAKYGTAVSPEDIVEWNLAKAFPTLTREMVYSPEYDESFWQTVDPMPGADRILRRLLREGHEIYVVTATEYETLKQKMDDLLFRWFPYLDWSHVIITANKQMIRGDVLIDDGIHNLEGWEYKKIMFTAPHNRFYDAEANGMIRVNTWEEAVRIIDRMAADAEQALNEIRQNERIADVH